MTSEQEYRRRAVPVAKRFTRPIVIAEIVGIGLSVTSTTFIVFLTRDLPRMVSVVLAVGGSVAIGVAFVLLALGSRNRQALEAFAWIGERDLNRFIRETGSRPPTTRRAARRWLERHPETADNLGHRVDVLLMAGDAEGAHATAERMATSTPWEVLMREVQLDYAERVMGSEVERPGLRVAAEALVDPEERRYADVCLAWGESQRAALADGDWRAPLVRARQRLGRHGNGTLLRSRVVRGIAVVLGVANLAGVLLFMPAYPS